MAPKVPKLSSCLEARSWFRKSTSEFFRMPGAAIDAGLVEHVLPLGQIAAALVLLAEETVA
jgi:chemotaxis response regulator CheB